MPAALAGLNTTILVVIFGLSVIELNYLCYAENITNTEYSTRDYFKVAVEKSLVIKHLKEGAAYKEIFNTRHENCDFDILYQYPSTPEFLQIDKVTHMLTSIELDREHEAFSKMLIPQIQAELELECRGFEAIPYNINQRTPIYESSPLKLDGRSYVLTKDIHFSPLTMVLNVIIEDVNDNAPQFIHPPHSNFLLGYPEANISDDIFPDYLLQVQAIDVDVGMNAMVMYKVQDNDHFGINPTTGHVYPYSTAMHKTKKVVLTISATDRNGSSEGRSTAVDVHVKKILSNHLVLLKLERSDPIEALEALEEIRNKIGIHFHTLKEAIVPTIQLDKGRRSILENEFPQKTIVFKVWIYAFSPIGKFIEGKELVSKISELGDNVQVSAVAYLDMKFVKNLYRENIGGSDIVILIIILLIVLLLVVSLVVSFLYWYCAKLRNHRKMSTFSTIDTRISTISSEFGRRSTINEYEHQNSVSVRRDSILKARDRHYQKSLNNKRESNLKNRRGSLDETSHDATRIARRLHSILGNISENQNNTTEKPSRHPPDRRKSSVTFNDTVKFINIGLDGTDTQSVASIRL